MGMQQFIQGLKVLVAGFLILLITACAVTDKSISTPEQWLASEQRDHVLVGRLWSVAEQSFVELQTFIADLPDDHWLLIGEQHDHPDHQRLVLEWVQLLAANGRMGVLALEMARLEQQPLLDANLGKQVVPEDLSWLQGWPWERYGALVQEGLLQAQQVLATDPARDKQMQVYRDGAPQQALTTAQAEALDALIDQGHCGMLPADRLPAMRQVQLLRDQVMAETLARVKLQGQVGLFLAGSVHTRKDIGIPRWLPDDVEHTSLWLVQVNQHQLPEEYLAAGVDGIPMTDYIYFTPAIPAVDYCEAFRSSGQSSSRK
jgi:uncharacterized iron-regulated protein